jgi:CBS domain-containing protein
MQQVTAAKYRDQTLVTIPFDRTMEEAYRFMEQWGVRHLPVTDAGGAVVGILADRDVYRAMNPRRPGFDEGSLVADFMSWPAISVSETESLCHVADTMATEKVSALLIHNQTDTVVGIITAEDLLRIMAKEEKSSFFDSFTYAPVVREAMRELESVGI